MNEGTERCCSPGALSAGREMGIGNLKSNYFSSSPVMVDEVES